MTYQPPLLPEKEEACHLDLTELAFNCPPPLQTGLFSAPTQETEQEQDLGEEWGNTLAHTSPQVIPGAVDEDNSDPDAFDPFLVSLFRTPISQNPKQSPSHETALHNATPANEFVFEQLEGDSDNGDFQPLIGPLASIHITAGRTSSPKRISDSSTDSCNVNTQFAGSFDPTSSDHLAALNSAPPLAQAAENHETVLMQVIRTSDLNAFITLLPGTELQDAQDAYCYASSHILGLEGEEKDRVEIMLQLLNSKISSFPGSSLTSLSSPIQSGKRRSNSTPTNNSRRVSLNTPSQPPAQANPQARKFSMNTQQTRQPQAQGGNLSMFAAAARAAVMAKKNEKK